MRNEQEHWAAVLSAVCAVSGRWRALEAKGDVCPGDSVAATGFALRRISRYATLVGQGRRSRTDADHSY